jgi:curved DNA-binding protein CbpA
LKRSAELGRYGRKVALKPFTKARQDIIARALEIKSSQKQGGGGASAGAGCAGSSSGGDGEGFSGKRQRENASAGGGGAGAESKKKRVDTPDPPADEIHEDMLDRTLKKMEDYKTYKSYKAQFRRLAKAYHPDIRGGTDKESEQYKRAQRIFQKISEHHDTFGEEIKKREEDLGRREEMDESVEEQEEGPVTCSDMIVFDNYADWKSDFERTHCKILHPPCYIVRQSPREKATTYSEGTIKASYKHIKHFEQWLLDPKIKRYTRMDYYPNPARCPDNCYNLYIPYKYEGLTDPYERDHEAIRFIRDDFIGDTVCRGEEKPKVWLMKRLAHPIQYPDEKCKKSPLYEGMEGSGKSSVMELESATLGKEHVLDASPEQIFGNFNAEIEHVKEIYLDEAGMTRGYKEQLKKMTTNTTVSIQEKFVPKKTIISYHNFSFTTNMHNITGTKKDDRRNIIFATAKHRKKDLAFWKKFYDLLKDDNAMRSFYDYLKELPDVPRNFPDLEDPISIYQKELQEGGESIYEKFLQWIVQNFGKGNAELRFFIKDFLREWCRFSRESTNGKHDDLCNTGKDGRPMTCTKMGEEMTKLSRDIDGIGNSEKASKGNFRKLDILMLMKEFNMTDEDLKDRTQDEM